MSEEKNIVSKKDLWRLQAPAFNFELDEDQLLKKALSAGFVTRGRRATYGQADALAV